MTEQTEANKLAQEQETQPAEDVKEEIKEQAEEEAKPTEEATEEEPTPQELNHDAILRAGKLEALVAAYVPANVDVESELDYVGGLSVKDGKLVGEAKYRKAPIENVPAKTETKKATPRAADAIAADDWPKDRERIREYKRKRGMYNG